MNPQALVSSGCGCCSNRRQFLAAGCGACAGAALPGLFSSSAAADTPQAQTPGKTDRPRIRLIFACVSIKREGPDWPYIGFDSSGEIARVTAALRQQCPQLEVLATVAHTPDEAKKLLAAGDNDRIDGYIVYQLSCWIQVMHIIVASGKPTLIADCLYCGSGGFLVFTSNLRRNHKNFSVVSSTRIEDLAESAKCFEVLKKGGSAADFVAACDRTRRQRTPAPQAGSCKEDRLQVANMGKCLEDLKQVRLVTVGGRMQNLGQEIQQQLGITVIGVDFKEMAAAYQATNRERARTIAQRWKSTARAVTLNDADSTLEKSARMFLAQQAVMEKHKAEAITINCLGGFYGGRLEAYPCLGYVELLDNGLIGACEADLISTVTLITMRHLLGRPGYISDPVLDTSRRQIIYAHCVAPTKMFGPAGPSNPFEILTHSEDRRGASVRSFLPQGFMTTTMEIHPSRREILFHQAKAVDNVVNDMACRTKLAGEVVGDMDKLFTYWDRYGWHRVTYYGDLRDILKELATALKFTLVEEA